MSEKARRKSILLLSVIVVAVIILLMTVVYFIMDRGKMLQAYKSSGLLIDQVENYLDNNENRQQSLIDSLKENYISKAKAVSYIIDKMPGVESDLAEMIRIAKIMAIDEIHLFDDKGEIYSGTVPAYYGYNFDSGEQMHYFTPMLSDKTLSMCQDVTPNTAESKPMMYAICWNDSGKIMIQIGIEPLRLLDEMRSYDISELIMGIPTYDGVDIVLADKETGEILGSTKSRFVGKTMTAVGLMNDAEDIFDGGIHNFKTLIEMRPTYCSVRTYKEYAIAVIKERADVNREMPYSMAVVFVYLLISAAAIGFIVRYLTKRVIEEHTIANVDVMTGFLNRRAYENDMKMYGKGELPEDFAYISVDLNGLKEANDIYGHEAGDELIVGATTCMNHCFGNMGKLYRIGGDEFIAIIRTGKKNPDDLIMEYLSRTSAWSERHKRRLSTACGYASREKYPDKSVIELARIADEQMYDAKAEYYNSIGADRRKGLKARIEAEEKDG